MITSGVAFHHKWVKGAHGTRNQIRQFFFFFFLINPHMSVKLKLLHLFGCSQMIIEMFLIILR